MATNNQILKEIYTARWKNQPDDQVHLSYKDFEKILLRSGLYKSKPSCQTAWIRIGGEDCIVAERDSDHFDRKAYVVDLHYLRIILGDLRIDEIKKTKKIKTKILAEEGCE